MKTRNRTVQWVLDWEGVGGGGGVGQRFFFSSQIKEKSRRNELPSYVLSCKMGLTNIIWVLPRVTEVLSEGGALV